MIPKLPIFLKISIVIIISLLIFRGCNYWFWGEGEIDRTLNAFQNNRNSFDELIAWVHTNQAESCIKEQNIRSCLPKQFQENTKNHFSVSYVPFIVEVSPVNFYYVLVYTKQFELVKDSDVFKDEGKILQSIDKNWTLVKRGWM